MDDIYTSWVSKYQASVSDADFHFAHIPTKNMSKEQTIQSPGSRQRGEQGNRIRDIGIQQADKRLLENMFGTVVAKQCKCYLKNSLEQRGSSRVYRTPNEGGLCSPNDDAVEKLGATLKETGHTTLSYNTKQGYSRTCSGKGYHATTNRTTLHTQNEDIINHQLDNPYEKLNKQTMEPQPFPNRITEFGEMNEVSSQLYPFLAMLHAQNLKYIDIISQRMLGMAVQQFNLWTKSNYTAPTHESSQDECEVQHSIYNDRGHEHPTNTDIELTDGPGIHSTAAALSVPYLMEQQLTMPHTKQQKHGDGIPADEAMNRSRKHEDRSDDDMKDFVDVNISRHYCVQSDADFGLIQDSGGNVLPGLNPMDAISPNHGPDIGVDRFGLPLTIFESDTKHNA